MCRTSNKMKRTACIFSRLRDSIWKVPGHQELWAYLQNQSSKDEVHSFILFFMLDFPVCFHLGFVLFFFCSDGLTFHILYQKVIAWDKCNRFSQGCQILTGQSEVIIFW